MVPAGEVAGAGEAGEGRRRVGPGPVLPEGRASGAPTQAPSCL